MSDKKKTQKLFCRCGCGAELIRDNSWRKYSRNEYISGHNVPITNAVSLLDKTKDTRKGQTGFLATKVISNIRHDAIKAGYKWELEDIFVYQKIIDECTYCGRKADWPNGRNGIDRVDSQIGYVKENCVSCCKECNRAKSNQTTIDFYLWVNRIYKKCLEKGIFDNLVVENV